MFKKLICLVALCAAAFNLSAEDQYLIEIKPGKKVLHASRLNLPQTTTLGEILTYFPELLSRNSQIDNYDLKIDDVYMEASASAMLENLRLSDIKDIEVSTSPGVSQQKNGQGGVIKVVPKKSVEGVSGRATLVTSTLLKVNPGAIINYKKGKLDLRGSLILNYTDPHKNISNTYEQASRGFSGYTLDTCRNRSGYELSSIYMRYDFTPKTYLKAWLRESFSIQNADHNMELKSGGGINSKSTSSDNRNFNLNGGALFNTFLTDRWVLEAQLEYTLEPTRYNSYSLETVQGSKTADFADRNTSHTIETKVEGKYIAVPKTETQLCEVVGGINTNFTPTSYDYDYKGKFGPLHGSNDISTKDLHAKGNYLYLSPYVECNSVFGPYFLKAGLRFQHYHYRINVTNSSNGTFHNDRNDLTAFINFGYQIAPHHHLSTILDRSIRRPTPVQVYPFTIYNPIQEAYNVGNSNLKTTSLHKASVTYASDYAFTGGHDLTVTATLEYINAQKLINEVDRYSFITYLNNGSSNIANMNLSANYQHKAFTISLTGNMFQNWSLNGGVRDNYFYYNLSITPSMQFNDGWGLNARFTYNSNIRTKQSLLSDYFYSSVRLNKTINCLTLFMELADNFHEYAEDRIFGEALTTLKYYDLHRPSMIIGASYQF